MSTDIAILRQAIARIQTESFYKRKKERRKETLLHFLEIIHCLSSPPFLQPKIVYTALQVEYFWDYQSNF